MPWDWQHMSYFCVFLSRSEPGSIKCTEETIRVSRRDVPPMKNGDTKCQNQPEAIFNRARFLPQQFEEAFPI